MAGRRRDGSRLRALAVVLIVLVTPAVAAGCLSPKPVPPKAYTATFPSDRPLPSPRTGKIETTGRGPEAPTTHAWFGAYVGNSALDASSRMNAVAGFESQIGRPLSIVHTFHPWGTTFPTALDYDVAQRGDIDMVSWAGTDTISIASGVYDHDIKAFADGVRTFRDPVLLRFRWEMDRPNLSSSIHSGADYIAAWDHVRAIFTAEGAT
ncbi:MAG TPA: beta-mannanase, partial [Micromonosporaceae bacterium]